jgi:hypothetical protein
VLILSKMMLWWELKEGAILLGPHVYMLNNAGTVSQADQLKVWCAAFQILLSQWKWKSLILQPETYVVLANFNCKLSTSCSYPHKIGPISPHLARVAQWAKEPSVAVLFRLTLRLTIRDKQYMSLPKIPGCSVPSTLLFQYGWILTKENRRRSLSPIQVVLVVTRYFVVHTVFSHVNGGQCNLQVP